jgi:hypothetical protein
MIEQGTLDPCSRSRVPGAAAGPLMAFRRQPVYPMSNLSDRKPEDYVFEDWQRLHETDPEVFELRRKEALEAVIQSAPADMQPRLRGLQFRVDMERSRAGSDLGACLKAQSMMWDSLIRLQDALSELSGIQKDGMLAAVARTRVEAPKATVIPFRAARRTAPAGHPPEAEQ